MEQNNKTHLAKLVPVCACCFVLPFLAFLLVLTPQQKTKANISGQLNETKERYEAILKTTDTKYRARLSNELDGLQKKLGDFVATLENTPLLMFKIKKIALKEKLSMFSIETVGKMGRSSSSDSKYCKEIYYNVKFTSSYNQFAIFLNTLERYLPVIFVDQFKITKNTTEGLPHNVEMRLAVIVGKTKTN